LSATISNCSIADLDFIFSVLRELASDPYLDSNSLILLLDDFNLHLKSVTMECNISHSVLTSSFVGLMAGGLSSMMLTFEDTAVEYT
jgi:hypothetical protein